MTFPEGLDLKNLTSMPGEGKSSSSRPQETLKDSRNMN